MLWPNAWPMSRSRTSPVSSEDRPELVLVEHRRLVKRISGARTASATGLTLGTQTTDQTWRSPWPHAISARINRPRSMRSVFAPRARRLRGARSVKPIFYNLRVGA
jgi:hypothetical protein